MDPKLENAAEVLDYMDEHMATTEFRGETQKFLPNPNFDIVTSERVIRNLVSKDRQLYIGELENEEFVHRVRREGRKMFATCIFGEFPLTCLKALFEDGLSDAKFPFEEKDCPGQIKKRKFCGSFIGNQKLFNPAYLHTNSEQKWDGRVTKPIEYSESKSALLGQGAFGDVYEIRIHPSQRSFSSGANKCGFFAMKVTQHEGTREVSFHRAMANLSHHHLLKCLASFTFSSQYNMIYEKADCDVEKFMARYSDPRKLPGMTSDNLAQQLFGLADALSVIHNQGQSEPANSATLLVPGAENQKTGYIHDIKPENLLMFIYNQNGKKTYWFRLSGFSCAKVVDVLTSVSGKNRHSWKTVSKAGTPVYRAPEATAKGKTSRPYDLWSLGCVYLELLVWFLDGYTALTEFREKRECLVSPGGREDEGFYYTPKENDQFRLREVVLQRIESVTSRCKGPLKDIANAIPKLLQIDPQQRPSAKSLVEDLKHINTGARPPVEVGPSEQSNFAGTSHLSVPLYVSDSDSDPNFGSVVRIQQPTNK
ncbi:uncharacterized protein EKO05_0007461 [Ascochyta rabiei]|uniref:ATP binding n=1 Tax=Didymella rabiei TaxID=5454 RepID=A0A163EBN8_DIDRA|nr:uncharacterized protein EKO05_0007461 [Ascochyta rabiei]KZM23618.1 ATP binding [Ascochyta rabiei]UPX17085.1 hypothetical protein EKO05_0007461 [Ascochyta rabiei]